MGTAERPRPLGSGLVDRLADDPLMELMQHLRSSASLDAAGPLICGAAARAGGWDVVTLWALIPGTTSLRFVSLHGQDDVQGAALLVSHEPLDLDAYPCRTARTTGAATVLEDIRSADDGISRAAVAAGLPHASAVPIQCGETIQALLLGFSRGTPAEPTAGSALASAAAATALFLDRTVLERDLAFDRALLTSQNEATVDALLVVGPDGSIVSSNHRFRDLWSLPDEVMESGSDDAAIAAVIDQVDDAEAFIDRIRYLYAHPTQRAEDEISLKDGRLIARWTAPLHQPRADVHLGRAWFFRDVTEQRRSERQARFLADAAEALTATLDPDAALRDLANAAVPTIADWCIIDLLEGGSIMRNVALAHDGSAQAIHAVDLARDQRAPLDQDAPRGSHRVVRTGLAELELDIDDAWLVEAGRGDAERIEIIRSLRFRSYLCLPLIARERVIGALTLVTTSSGRRYDAGDLAFARALAERAALLVDGLRLYQQRDRLAATLQRSLLPVALPAIPGVDLAARYVASGDAFDVSGDFYDAFEMPDGTWGVVIGDVCGKGPLAAATTALARNTVRVAAMQSRRPKRILALLDRALHQHADVDLFCTATFARIRPGRDGFAATLSRGGHPPARILRRDGKLITIRGQGTLLGAVQEPLLADVTTHLSSGDILLLYTDGVTDARNRADEPFGDERLDMELRACVGRTADEIATHILERVVTFRGDRASDDIAIIALRAT